MGNKPQKRIEQQSKQNQLIRLQNERQTIIQNGPQNKWNQSQKSIQDLRQLIREQSRWPQIIRPYISKLTNKHEYQRYLRVILQEILNKEQCYDQKDEQVVESQKPKQMERQKFEMDVQINQISQNNKQSPRSEIKNMNKKKSQMSQNDRIQLFKFYKHKIQQSYFIVTEKGTLNSRNGSGDVQFEQALREIETIERDDQKSSILQVSSFYQVSSFIPSLMLTQLYQYASIKQKYLNQMFMQLNIKAFNSLQQFTNLLIEEYIIVDDQFNLCKFVIEFEVMNQSLSYLQTYTKLAKKQQRKIIYQEIRKLKENPTYHYISMCRIFLKYKNVQAARIILQNIIQKGYHLSKQDLKFFFYVEVYYLFLYEINYSTKKYSYFKDQNLNKNTKKYETQVDQGSFINFIGDFQNLFYEQIFHMFFLIKPYSQIQKLKRCFQNTFGLYQAMQGQSKFLKSLNKYALGSQCHFIFTIEALKNHLRKLQPEYRSQIQDKLLKKLVCQQKLNVMDYQAQLIQVMNIYKFSKPAYHLVRTLLRVGSLFSKFQIHIKPCQICQFMLHNPKYNALKKYQQFINQKTIFKNSEDVQELQYLALVAIKKIITKFFVLTQSKEEVIFKIQQKYDEECYEYSTKQIQSLFILTEYLHKNLFLLLVPLQQLHQLLFQHMLYFYKYDQVQNMLRSQNLERYSIQIQVIKMLLMQNIRQMLIKNQKQINIISQDIKKQLRIAEQLIKQSSSVQMNVQISQNSQGQIDFAQTEQLQEIQSIRALYKLLIKLDFYSISLNQEQKQNLDISILYFLIEHYEHQIQIFDYDEIYHLILIIQRKIYSTQNNLKKSLSDTSNPQPFVTNQFLKFKIDLAHLSYEKGKIKFGQQMLKQVLQYEPPWISSEIIKIIKREPKNSNINQNFLNIAFQYCVKGQDLIYLLQVWKQKSSQKNKKNSQKISQLFQTTHKYVVIDDTYINDQKQYRNLVAQMTFNDEILKMKDYQTFFTLLGTQPQRAFYLIYNKKLDIVKIQIILKQGMKMGILNILNISKIFFKLLYVSLLYQRSQGTQVYKKISYLKFKSIHIDQILSKIQSEDIFSSQQKNNKFNKSISFILLKKLFKTLKSLLILPNQFIQNYIENPSNLSQQTDQTRILYSFMFDQNYRQKHLISLKDEPMGKTDIKIYRQLCQINGLNILDLVVFNFTNQINTVQSQYSQRFLEKEKIQNILQKIITWTQNDQKLVHQILSKFILKIFSSEALYHVLNFIRQKQNVFIRQIITSEHMEILESLKQIQIHTELHGLITEHFFEKSICFSPKQKLSQKHIKILKKQLKLRNVFLISKLMYFCYSMSTQVEKQVLKLFVKQNQNQQQRQIFEELKKKVHQGQN